MTTFAAAALRGASTWNDPSKSSHSRGAHGARDTSGRAPRGRIFSQRARGTLILVWIVFNFDGRSKGRVEEGRLQGLDLIRDLRATSAVCANFPNYIPEIGGIPNEFQALNYQNGQLVANAEHYLRAVAVRNRRAKKYAEDLAKAVLAMDAVQLARDVLRGGPLKYTSATRLAETILMAAGITPSTKVENGDG